MQKLSHGPRQESRGNQGHRPVAICVAAVCLALAASAPADEIELMSGRRYRGLVLERTATEITFKAVLGGGIAKITIPMAMVRSVSIDGKMPAPEPPVATRPAPEAQTKPRTPPPEPAPAEPPAPKAPTPGRIDAIIDKAGRTPPAWWDETPLEYPKTLDLAGTNPVKGWAPQRNLGAYVFSVIQPNPRRWKSGARLLHHVVTVRKDNPPKLREAMEQLARLYQKFLKDWARAAFWYRQAQRRQGPRARYPTIVGLADCYYHLGNKAMAAKLLRKYALDRRGGSDVIQLWANMGRLDTALAAAKGWAASGRQEAAYMAAGNACRQAGRPDQAVKCYEKVLTFSPNRPNKLQAAARAAIEAVKLYDALDLSAIPDGAYTGQCTGYRGPIKVKVTVKSGRIESVEVLSHREDLFYTAFIDIPQRIVDQQGLKGVDTISGATVTSEAIINATANALSSGMSMK